MTIYRAFPGRAKKAPRHPTHQRQVAVRARHLRRDRRRPEAARRAESWPLQDTGKYPEHPIQWYSPIGTAKICTVLHLQMQRTWTLDSVAPGAKTWTVSKMTTSVMASATSVRRTQITELTIIVVSDYRAGIFVHFPESHEDPKSRKPWVFQFWPWVFRISWVLQLWPWVFCNKKRLSFSKTLSFFYFCTKKPAIGQ